MTLANLDAAMGATCYLTQPGTYQVNAPLYVPYTTRVVIGPGTIIKAVGTFASTAALMQDSPPTTVAAGSNGAATSAGTLNVASTTGYPSSGQVRVAITGGTAIIAYTGKTATSFTGCTEAGGTSILFPQRWNSAHEIYDGYGHVLSRLEKLP